MYRGHWETGAGSRRKGKVSHSDVVTSFYRHHNFICQHPSTAAHFSLPDIAPRYLLAEVA